MPASSEMANQRPVSRSRDHCGPIRGQYAGIFIDGWDDTGVTHGLISQHSHAGCHEDVMFVPTWEPLIMAQVSGTERARVTISQSPTNTGL